MINENEFNYSDMLYRFRSDSEYNFEALLKNEMFAATPNILNDPLDCPITYDLNKLYKKLLRRNSFVEKHAVLIFPPSEEKKNPSDFKDYESYHNYYQTIYQEACSKLFDIKYASVVKDYIRTLAKSIVFDVRECFGIVSFSLTCDSGLMWSHYASNYKGFVLGYNLFDLKKCVESSIKSDYFLKKFAGICGLFKVIYVSTEDMADGTDLMYELLSKKMADKYEFSEMTDFILSSKHKQLLLTLLTTKDKSWEYEQEVRLILPREDAWHSLRAINGEASLQYFKVSDCYYPKTIIIGSNMSDVNKAAIGFYCYKNNRVILQRINTERLMSERELYLTPVKPKELV